MRNYRRSTVLAFILITVSYFIPSHPLSAQKVIVNGYDSIFELDGGPGSCSTKPGIAFCSNSGDSRIYSSALHNDTLYFVTGRGNDLYRATLNSPGSCRFLTLLPDDYNQTLYNSLTVDLYGRVYGVSNGGLLFRYDRSSTKPVVLGLLPQPPGGDMLYYNGNMFYATQSGEIYQINLENPSQSSLYMSVPQYTFFGLISFPFDCDKNKVYGIANSFPGSKLVGIDMENKTLTGEECDFPFQIFDAASVVEDGKTAGIIVDSVTIKGSCGDVQNAGSIRIHAFTATKGAITYMLDGMSNNTGEFYNVSPGQHRITATNARNCTIDTIIEVKSGPSTPIVSNLTINPTTCDKKSGSISIAVNGNSSQVTTSLDNGPVSQKLVYNNLDAKEYLVSVFKGNECRYDTIVNVAKIADKKPGIKINLTQPKCGFANGEIDVEVDGEEQPYKISIGDVSYEGTSHNFANLDGGAHELKITSNNECSWDTVVNLEIYSGEPVDISYEKNNPTCKIASSGSARVKVTGNAAPYFIIHNDRRYSSGEVIPGLGPGAYAWPVINNTGCTRDTVRLELTLIEEPECDRFFMPNAFSPNSDGINDYVRPHHSIYLKNVDLKFFNRYGQIVYIYNGSGDGWDGRFKNNPQPSGGYTWQVTYTNFKGEVVRKYGTIILIR